MSQRASASRGSWTPRALRVVGTLVLIVSVIPVLVTSFNFNGVEALVAFVVYGAMAFTFFALCHAVAAIVEHVIAIRRSSDEIRRSMVATDAPQR
jgi:hypothetical protein